MPEPRNPRYEFRCNNPTCGFRVHENYFMEKPRFTPGLCPRSGCGSALRVVNWHADTVVSGVKINSDGAIVPQKEG